MITNFKLFETNLVHTIVKDKFLCVKSDAPEFTAGKIYDCYEEKSNFILIVNDHGREEKIIENHWLFNKKHNTISTHHYSYMKQTSSVTANFLYAYFMKNKTWEEYQKILKERSFDL